MKWFKRLVIAVCLLVLCIGVLLGSAYYVSKSKPDWYLSRKIDAAAEQSARDKLAVFQNWVAQVNNWPHIQNRPRVDTDPATAPAREQSIELTEQELNSVLAVALSSLQERLSKYLTDPYVALRDGHVILAGMSKDMGNVVSIHIKPEIDDKGMLRLTVDDLKAGSLSVPSVLWQNYVEKLQTALSPKLEYARLQSHIEPDGTGNEQAVASAMNRMLLNMLKDKPSDAVLFLPHQLQEPKRGHPVKLVKVDVADEKLSMTVVTLTQSEQAQLLNRLRAPLGEEPPPAITATEKEIAVAYP